LRGILTLAISKAIYIIITGAFFKKYLFTICKEMKLGPYLTPNKN
jgi:hypothetical protein